MTGSSLSWYGNIIADVVRTVVMIWYYTFKSWVEFFYVPPKNLSGEIVFLTGAGGGFGSLLAKKLAKKGCILALVDINEEDVTKVASDINECCGDLKAFPFICDVTNPEEIEEVALRVEKEVGYPTIVINNAGVLAGKYFMDTPYKEILRTFHVNTFSHYYIVKRFLPYMLEQNHGHIVSVSSILGMDSVAGVADYGPSKAAATTFMHALRQELRLLNKDKIFCTNVLPYKANTLLFKGVESRFKKFPLLPTQCPDHVTNKIVTAIEKNQITVYVPRILYFAIALLHVLPERAFDYVYDFLRVNQGMKTYVGRKKE